MGLLVILGVQCETLAVDDLAVLHYRHVGARPALRVDQFDRLRHCVGILAAVLHGLEPEAAAVHRRILRTIFGRQLLKSVNEPHYRSSRSPLKNG
jgi:hypothetical protein